MPSKAIKVKPKAFRSKEPAKPRAKAADKNLAEMLALLDSGGIGKLSLLCSAFFRDHNKDL